MQPAAGPPASDSRSNATPSHGLRVLSWVASMVVIGGALWLLHRYLHHIAWRDVAAAWSRMPAGRIACSAVAAAVSLAMLALFDVLAARVVAPRRVSAGLAAFAGAVTQSISNTLGFHAITGTALRYRIYASAGLGAGDIGRIVGLAGLGVGLGFAVVITGALCWEPAIAQGWGRWPGMALVLLLVALAGWLARPRTLVLGRLRLPLPNACMASAQMLIGGVEMLAAISALYVLLPAASAPPFVDFLPIYVGAVLAGIVSHSPGGLGVFETIMLASFAPSARADLLAAMLCYRVNYNLLPFVLGSAALAVFELRLRRLGRLNSKADNGGSGAVDANDGAPGPAGRSGDTRVRD
jgi:phosphatidylglycerol lysyltransferase